MLNREVNKPEESISLMQIARFVYKGRWLFLLFFILSMAFAYYYWQKQPPRYRATVTFFINSENSPRIPSAYSYFLDMSQNNLQAYLLEALNSDRVSKKVLSSIKSEYPTLLETHLSKLKEKKRSILTEPEKLLILKNSILDFNKNLKITSKKKGLISIEYEFKESKVTLEVVRNHMVALVEVYKSMELSSQKEILTILDSPYLYPKPLRSNLYLIIICSVLCSQILCGLLLFTKKHLPTFLRKIKE